MSVESATVFVPNDDEDLDENVEVEPEVEAFEAHFGQIELQVRYCCRSASMLCT